MDLTIEIPQDVAVVLIRALEQRTAKAHAGEAEYSSWKPDLAEYDSWPTASRPADERANW